MRSSSSRISSLIAIACLTGTMAFGSGFSIFEQGAKASGMAGAFVATADDPSAIFYNPAGLGFQREKMSLLGGATFINFTNEFTGDSDSAFTSGVEGTYDRHLFAPPNGYGTYRLNDHLVVGVGMFSAFGLRTDWADPWAGRFISKDVDLKTVSVNPSFAWRVNDSLSFGGGIEYRRARVTLSRNTPALNPFTGRIADVANGYLRSDWNNDWGWNAGVLFKPTPNFSVGASYRAAMDIELDGSADITQIMTGNAQFDALVATQLPPDQGINTTIPFPAMTAIGIATTAIPNWQIEFDVTHATWSRFKTLDVQFATTPSANIVRPQDWEDTMAFRLGANRNIGDQWAVRFGAVYDQNPQPLEAVSPLLPDSDRMGLTFGVGWYHGPLVIEVSDMILHFKDRNTGGVNPDQFEGTYETDANLLSVNFGLRF